MMRPISYLPPVRAICSMLLAFCCSTTAIAANYGGLGKPSRTAQISEEIARIESQFGAFSADLGEHLLALADTYQKRGKHQEAVVALKRALHVQRINEGLYALSQSATVEKLIENQIAMGDWAAADKKHDHLFWLHQQNFGAQDPRMLPMLAKMSEWHLNAFSMTPDANAAHLLDAYKMYQQSLDIIEFNYGEHDLQKVEPLRGFAISNYHLATLRTEEPRLPTAASTLSISSRDSRALDAERKARLDAYRLNSFHNGRRALNEVVQIFQSNDEASPVEAIKAQIQLGDWYMLFDRPSAALGEYRKAQGDLEQAPGQEASAENFFSKPVALPYLRPIESEINTNPDEQEQLLVRFDVTERGEARNIEFLDDHPTSTGARAHVRRTLRKAKFRPQIVAGEPVYSSGIIQRYLVPKS